MTTLIFRHRNDSVDHSIIQSPRSTHRRNQVIRYDSTLKRIKQNRMGLVGHKNYLFEDSDGAAAWAADRLPFQPRGWKLTYREDLREALRAIPDADGILVAELATTSRAFFDVENVLLYNVGASSLKHLTHRGIAFRLAPPLPIPAGLRRDHSPTRVSYRQEMAPNWLDDATVAGSFTLTTRKLNSSTKPHFVWWATSVIDNGTPPITGAFGLTLQVSPPERPPHSNPVQYIKPLLDGVIAALQADSEPRAPAVSRLAMWLQVDEQSVRRRLQRPGLVRSDSRLLRATTAGLHWNPADDRCTAVILHVGEASGRDWSVTGKVHTLK